MQINQSEWKHRGHAGLYCFNNIIPYIDTLPMLVDVKASTRITGNYLGALMVKNKEDSMGNYMLFEDEQKIFGDNQIDLHLEDIH